MALSYGLDKGAAACDLIWQDGQSFTLSAHGGGIDKYKVAGSRVLGVRTIREEKIGLASTEAATEEAIKIMVDDALQNSAFAGTDPLQTITVENSDDLIEDGEKICRPDTTPAKNKIDLALDLEKKIMEADSKVVACPHNGYSDNVSEHLYLNHLGTFCAHRERVFSCYTSALFKDGSHQSMHHKSSVSREFAGLNPAECVEESLEIGRGLLHGKPVPTARMDVIFDIEVWQSLLNCFLGLFSAKTAMEGKNSFKDKLGETIAHPAFSLRDAPMYTDGFQHISFDDEGMKKAELELVEGGVLRNFLHNSITAAFFGTRSTAHAARSARTPMGVSGSQFVIRPGEDAEDGLKSGRWLQVVQLQGLHSGTNAISGDFSLGATGFLHSDGARRPVREVTVSGNFFDLIRNIAGIGDRLHSSGSRSFFSPLIRFSDLSIAGS